MKDYKKILEGVVDIINATENSDIGFINICAYIGENCPELKESEGERISKKLLALIEWSKSYTASGITTDEAKEMTDWLENQGEQKPITHKYNVGATIYYNSFGETKSMVVANVVDIGNGNPMYEDTYGSAVFEKDIIEQKPAWSEEDSLYYDDICELLINILHSESRNYNMEAIKKDLDWLKSLKDRVQLQNITYYNPYKEVVESIAEMCKHYDTASHSGLRDFYDNVKIKCKDAKEYDSLYHQNHWKPSDEQIEALDEVYKTHGANNVCRRVLFNLMNDLKKLKE